MDSEPSAMSSGTGLIKVKKYQVKYFRETPLYCCTSGNGCELYKPSGVWISDLRINADRYPNELYMDVRDKTLGLRELQSGLNDQLTGELRSGDPEKIRETLEVIVRDTLLDPRSGNLGGAAETVNSIVDVCSERVDIIKNLVSVSAIDYSTAVHSINVMALTVGYAFFCGFQQDEIRKIGLCALLHDVGKTEVPTLLLKAPRRLTDFEFDQIKQHTTFGYKILKGNLFDEDICLCALQHHERRDGSGYPNGVTDISYYAEIVGMIDCYEAITCNDRPYRNAMRPFSALSLIKKELSSGRFNTGVFENFVMSLGRE